MGGVLTMTGRADRKVRLTGPRSLQSKYHRLAYELADDASRVRADHPERENLAAAIDALSSRLGDLYRSDCFDE